MDTIEQRPFPRLGRSVSVVGLGCWQLGADWGEVTESAARAVLDAAYDAGVTFFDTADVYGDGRSEKLIGQFLRGLGGEAASVLVATKAGRRAAPHLAGAYTAANVRGWVERSQDNLGVETIDLLQLHCPPTSVYMDDSVFDALDGLVADKVLAGYGVSVETVDEALTAIARPGVASVQIILNAFRLKPIDAVLPVARKNGVGIIARVPLASGMLTGRYTTSTTFAASDHRTYNRRGEAFNVGETFSGVDYETGLRAVQELKESVPAGWTLPQAALRWIIDQPGVTAVIPGARNTDQARANAAVAGLGPVGSSFTESVTRVYDEHLRAAVHPRW